jgi:hypothetical protein
MENGPVYEQGQNTEVDAEHVAYALLVLGELFQGVSGAYRVCSAN